MAALARGGGAPASEREAAIALLRQEERRLDLLHQQRAAASAQCDDAAALLEDGGGAGGGNGSDLLFLDLYMRPARSIMLSVPPDLRRAIAGRTAETVIFAVRQGGVPKAAATAAAERGGASEPRASAAVMEVGGIAWAASVLLAQRIIERGQELRQVLLQAAADSNSGAGSGDSSAQPLRVLELGCGAAVIPGAAASLALQPCGSQTEATSGVRVTATDLLPVVPAAQATLQANSAMLSSWGVSASSSVDCEPQQQPESEPERDDAPLS
eukprot:COSAG06_NODE_18574_length_880_cov_0.928297_1_plen_269_part_01